MRQVFQGSFPGTLSGGNSSNLFCFVEVIDCFICHLVGALYSQQDTVTRGSKCTGKHLGLTLNKRITTLGTLCTRGSLAARLISGLAEDRQRRYRRGVQYKRDDSARRVSATQAPYSVAKGKARVRRSIHVFSVLFVVNPYIWDFAKKGKFYL